MDTDQNNPNEENIADIVFDEVELTEQLNMERSYFRDEQIKAKQKKQEFEEEEYRKERKWNTSAPLPTNLRDLSEKERRKVNQNKNVKWK